MLDAKRLIVRYKGCVWR